MMPMPRMVNTAVLGVFEKVPIGHATHWVAPMVDANWPGAQGLQPVAPAIAEKNPGRHAEQTADPDEAEKEPGEHDMHEVLPAADAWPG